MAIAAALVRRNEIAVLFLAALAILLIAPGVISAETKSEGTTEEPIWSADMLVVEYTSVSIGAASADLFSNIGGSADLQIKSLWSHIPDRDLRLSFEDGITDAADYTLQVGDLTLEFPEESSGDNRFKWTEVDVDWEDGQTIPVSIVQTSALEEPEEKEEPAANTPATGAPTISGTAQVDETVMAETSSIADEDGLDGASYSYQWTRSDGSTYADLVGETDSTYTLLFADQGKTIKVRVSFNDDADNEETLTSEATVEVAAAPNRPATGAPTISGTPQVDQTLTAGTSDIADEDGVNDVSYSYQWMADDADIEEATDSTYTPSVSDVGRTIKVKVSFTDDRNNTEARTSLATTAVLATVPTQPLSLTVATGDEIQELDASWQAPSSNGGSSITGYKVQWKRSADSWDTEADVSQATVTGTTHTIPGLTGGVEYAVRVIASNTAGDGPASDEVAGTPAGGTSQQQTGDSTSPTVSSIAITSDPGSDEVYAIGDAIQITVAFSADVTVTGKPQLELDIGGNAKPAEYQSTNASSTVFSYTVAEGDSDTDGIAVTENKLTLNGGSIKDAGDNAANLAHSALPAQTGHKVDGVRPTISSINLGGSKTPNLFILDEVMGVSVLFTEEIFLDGSPYITLDVDSGPQVASFERIRLPCPDLDASTSTATLALSVPEGEDPPPGVIHCFRSDTHGISMSFNYTVAKGDLDSDGVGIPANALSLNGGTLRDAAGNDAVITHEALADSPSHVIDGVPPEITSIEIISDPGEDDTYAAGDTIKLNITFSERLEIDFGSPRLRLDIGGKTRMAYRVRRNVLDIQAGETGYIMAYSYTVQDGDNDEDGISIPANPVHRLWAYVKDINGNDAIFEHEAIADDAEHKVATTTAAADTDNAQKTGLLTISGTLQVGETVSADFSNLTDDDGVDYAASTAYYSWSREGGGLSFLARGNPSYVIASADEGKKLRVNVEFFDDNGNKEYLRSPWTEPVGPRAPSNSAPTGLPTITGTPQVDQTLTANTSSIDDGDGLDGVSYRYQWIRSDNGADTNIVGKTDSTYTLVYADQGRTIKVKVSFADDADNDETLTSEATEVVTAAPNRAATGEPTISGTPQVDQTLTAATSDIADEDGVDGVSYNYQWMADDVNIDGASASTYVPADGDAGKAIKVSVSFTDDRNNDEARTSLATTAVLATVPTQPLSLTVATGDEIQELDVSWQAPSSNGGSSITGYKVRWKRSADSWDTEADVSQATVTGTTHTIPGLTGGVEYAVRVIASNTAGDGPASDEVAGTPAGGTSQQQTGDSTSPTVSSIAITSDTGDEESTWDDDGIYGIGDIISVTVTFSEDVTVKGSPRLELNIGGAAKKAEYKSAVGSKVVFSYTVAEGDSDSDGIAISENKLTLNGGSIKDAADNAADLTHDALAAQADHQVDGVRPTISLVALGYTTGGVVDDTYILGQELPFAVKFSEEVIADGSPQLTLDFDSGPKQATFFYIRLPCLPSEIGASDIVLVSSNGCLTSDTRGLVMVFSYTISMGDEDSDGLGIGANALSANGTISDAAGNEAVLTHEAVADSSNHKIDGVPPEVTSIEIISDPGEDDTYAAGDIIKLNVTFSERLEVHWQYPRLRLDIGDKARMAYRVRRNPLDIRAGEIGYVMAYSYTVQDGDKDDDGISIPANALHRLWGELQDTNGNEVELGHEALASDASHKVATTFVESTDTTAKTGLLTITGTLRVGEIVTADLSNLTDDDGLDYAADSAHYAWGREGGGLYFEAMRDPRYVIAAADKGKKLRVDLQFFDDNGNKEYRRSAWTDPVGLRAPSNNSATGAPTITGTPQVDQTLTANTSSIDDGDGLDSVSYSYQWIRSDNGADTDIAGETDSTYTLVLADLGKTIKVQVTFTDDADNDETLTSEATVAVAAAPNRDATGQPTISGTPQVDETLTADTSAISDEDGLANVSYQYQWLRDDADIAGQTNSTYRLVSADQDKTIKVRVTFRDDADNAESLTSIATTAVASQPAETPAVLLTASFANVPADHNGEQLHLPAELQRERGGRLRPDPRPRLHRHRCHHRQRQPDHPGQQPGLERGGKPHRQRLSNHNPAGDHRLRRQRRNLHG